MRKYFFIIVIALSLILLKLDFIWSLECIYCPTYSTEEECNQMNLTQICINATKCGYARFIEKGNQLLHGHNVSFLIVTVKKGCMEEDYCTKVQQNEGVSHVNFSQCLFCDEDLCPLEYPLLCWKCNEAIDEYCEFQTGSVATCGPEEVCYEQRNRETHKLKRGCIEPSKCRKENLCRDCDRNLCLVNPMSRSSMQNKRDENEDAHKNDNFNENSSRAQNSSIVHGDILSNVFLTIFLYFSAISVRFNRIYII